jgi:4-hydroxy-3-polyprenylbenzoate decarboxylase
MSSVKTITLAISGASGARYGLRLLECLLQAKQKVYLVVSPAAKAVFQLEENIEITEDYFKKNYEYAASQLHCFSEKQWTAPIASGSGISDAMVVCPCSSSTLAAIAHGLSDNLLERAADVTIKEKKPLILVHRETPLSVIHLQNMLSLAKMGVTIMPASPGFYQKPEEVADLIDFMVARVLDHLGIPQTLLPPWGKGE